MLDTSGRFLIDEGLVDKHANELKLQLDSCQSILAWIQAYNSYAVSFFTTMFGKPYNALGGKHVERALATSRRTQKARLDTAVLIDHGEKSVTEPIKTMIEKRFNVTDVPDGFIYFPTELCGLDLCNPFISLV